MYILEETVEALARQLLLLLAFTDLSLPLFDRLTTFLDLHHNALLTPRTSAYLAPLTHLLSSLLSSHQRSTCPPTHCAFPLTLDPSHLKHRTLDSLLSHLSFISPPPTPSPPLAFLLPQLRESRLRQYYGERYDSRANVIDADYHWRLKAVHSIHHIHHFRRWRMTGQGYERVGGVEGVEMNRTLAGYREGKVKGRGGVEVRGYWGDVVVGPHAVWGCEGGQDATYEVRQDRHVKTAVDVAEEVVGRLMERGGGGGIEVTVYVLQGGVGGLGVKKWGGKFDRAWVGRGGWGDGWEGMGRLMKEGGWLSVETMWGWPLKEEEKQAAVDKLRVMGKRGGWEWRGGRREVAREGIGGSEGKDRTAHGPKVVNFVWRTRRVEEEKKQQQQQLTDGVG